MASCRGWLPFAFLTTGLLLVGPIGTLAQSSDAVCLPSFSWMDNSENQDPCTIGAYLQGACNGGQFTVDPLPNGTHYTGPYVDQQNPCQCSSVTYNTISACGLCQNRTAISWSAWNYNCTTVYPGVFPPGVPDGTAVPQWAYQDVTVSDMFNVTLAESVGDNPESTAVDTQSTGSAGPTSTNVAASLTASPSLASSTSSTSDASSTTGAIAGGVVGGVVGVALIAGVVIFLLMRKKGPQIPSSAQYTVGPSSPSTSGNHDTTPFTPQMVQAKLYDPSDPSTFPSTPPPAAVSSRLSDIHTPVTNIPTANYSTHSMQPSGHYSGVPEI